MDEPLRWMLTNPRALKLARTRDNLWLNILDVQRALEARTYAATDALVLGVDGVTWRLDASPDGAACTAAPGVAADVSLTVNELGSLYLGGVRASEFRDAGRIVEHTSGAATRLDALLQLDRAPHNAVGF
ncbi:sterol carrier protein domain-containing protein [Kribbella yunnanensis]